MTITALVSPVGDSNVAGSSNSSMTMTVSMSVMGWMLGVSNSLNDCFETGMGSRFVFHNTVGTICLLEGVSPGGMMPVSVFVLRLVVDNAHYKFEYGVHDPHTHDHKSQHEHRDGHHATGGYTLKEADGTHRIVKYKSGPHTGFEAVVERVGHAQHPAHYGHGHGHGHGGVGGTSYVGVTHWANQGSDGHEH
uniref:Cuticular protein 58 n=1 Tax=Leptinotarsa decemlineata TaxID=7539 RepID=A0A3S7SJX4_LEPDE|nr:cuticular protein 58 [Leptinotarsa decemlineata]